MLSRRGFLHGVSSGVAATGAAFALGGRAARAQVLAPTLTTADLKPGGPLDEAYWWKVRSQFNILDGMTFMNNGTEGPVPRVVVEANEASGDLTLGGHECTVAAPMPWRAGVARGRNGYNSKGQL